MILINTLKQLQIIGHLKDNQYLTGYLGDIFKQGEEVIINDPCPVIPWEKRKAKILKIYDKFLETEISETYKGYNHIVELEVEDKQGIPSYEQYTLKCKENSMEVHAGLPEEKKWTEDEIENFKRIAKEHHKKRSFKTKLRIKWLGLKYRFQDFFNK